MENCTKVREFILLGVTNNPGLQVPLFIMFTCIYCVDAVGNLGMIMLVLVDSHLHTPMSFFLCNLSLVDLGYSSAATPTVISEFFVVSKVVSYNACAAQMFFFIGFATGENYLLASMAYDHYAAVCNLLHYSTRMTTSVCIRLNIGCYICGFLNAIFHVGDIFSLSFGKSNVVHHFFCDVPALMALSCSNIHLKMKWFLFFATFNVFFALLIILVFYTFIFVTILKMKSDRGHQKVLSTCASHLTTVSIFYSTVIFMYLQPSFSHSMDADKIASMFYTMIIPTLNPLVYSLRNKEVNNAFKKVVKRVNILCKSEISD
ncbi:olfactory receptor 5B2-like [Chionomys nivalis]|uniref:olfactory receptor 5B2-like n=1 Tax=Chionomys nivalis TaxID=269649 RepID=UPI00259812A2|nr:olfactory receptor 5B2-like [Chionomys nivalis]